MEEFSKSQANYSRRTSGRIFRVQHACKYPKSAKADKIDDHKVGGVVEDFDVRDREGGKDPRLVESARFV